MNGPASLRDLRTGLAGFAMFALGLQTAGCAAIVGADFDVTARPSGESPGDPNGLQGPVLSNPARIEAPDGETELLGLSVAVDGDTILVGARDPDWAGHVFVVTRDQGVWSISSTLTAEGYAAPDAQFGSSAAISGDWALIGAKGNPWKSRSGAAYFFHRVNGVWSHPQEVTAPNPVASDGFGTRVALEGDVALIGAPGAGGADVLGGAAYVYGLDADGTWSARARLIPDDAQVGDEFGVELALRSDTVVIGAPGADEAAQDAGAAYVLKRTGASWSFGPKLVPFAADPSGYRLGDGTIGLDGNLLVVPAQGGPPGEQIHSFEADSSGNWIEGALLPPPGVASQSLGGWRATVRGKTAVLAARNDADIGMGLVYRRAGGTWEFVERLTSGLSSPDIFGWTVAYDGSTACFGAIFFRDQEGAVFVFDLSR